MFGPQNFKTDFVKLLLNSLLEWFHQPCSDVLVSSFPLDSPTPLEPSESSSIFNLSNRTLPMSSNPLLSINMSSCQPDNLPMFKNHNPTLKCHYPSQLENLAKPLGSSFFFAKSSNSIRSSFKSCGSTKFANTSRIRQRPAKVWWML